MARLIDANALLLEIEEELSHESHFFTTEQNKLIDMGLRIAAGDIRHQPTVDAVEVVQCRDCAVPHNKYTGCQKLNGLVTTPDFYCPFGKRKDGDGNG